MKILYFHRNKNAGFSINKVFQSITETLPQYNISYKEKYIPSPNAKIKDIIPVSYTHLTLPTIA